MTDDDLTLRLSGGQAAMTAWHAPFAPPSWRCFLTTVFDCIVGAKFF